MSAAPSAARRELAFAALSAAAPAVLLGAVALRGRTLYWSDLTYLHQAWRAAPATLLQGGRPPLWEPTLYFGMPMLASMQGGLLYPLYPLFALFGFATATALFQLAHAALAAWLGGLWLRAWGLPRGAALGGGLVLSVGGLMVSRLPYLNHLAALAWAPALPLFFRRPWALGLVLAFMYLGGYPTFIPGLVLAAWLLAAACAREKRELARDAVRWAAAAAGAMALSAAQLLPALELAARSRRAGGVPLEEALLKNFSLRDLLQWIGPAAMLSGGFDPKDAWWMAVYLGLAGAAAAALGLARLPRRRALVLAAGIAAVLLVTLGAATPVSGLLWRKVALLRFVRYPGNLAYAALLPFAALIGAGLAGSLGPLLVPLMAVELVWLGFWSTPVAPREIYTIASPLVRRLQGSQDGLRYLLSPKALELISGATVYDWRGRLYGLTNAPYRLRAVSNFGDPLAPVPSYDVMDRMLSQPGLDAAAAWLPWLGASRLYTPDVASSKLLAPEGWTMWYGSRVKAPAALAWKLSPEAGAALPAGWPAAPPPLGTPLPERREREDRFAVSGEGRGWLFVSEPLYPGWTATLETPGGSAPARPEPALVAFQKLPVPDGPWTVRWRYEPLSWALGLWLSGASLLALAGAWYHRLPRR